jgi:hypothetical protein
MIIELGGRGGGGGGGVKDLLKRDLKILIDITNLERSLNFNLPLFLTTRT